MNIKVNNHFVNLEKKRHKYASTIRLNDLVETYKKDINPKDLNTDVFWNKKLIYSQNEIEKSSIYIHKLRIVKNYLNKKSGNVLDIGVGYGDVELHLSNNKNLKWSGIDISNIAIANINKKITGTFKIGSVFKLPFKNKYFKYILCLDILEHLPANKISSAYKEITRVLDKNGILIFSIPINEDLNKMLKSGQNPNGHMRIYTPELIRAELLINNFKIIKYYELYAFARMYWFKNILVRLVPHIWNIKPNLFIGMAIKK